MMDKNDANQKTRESVILSKEPKKQTGAVTFLDVLGWKGIWRDRDWEDRRNPIESLDNLISKIIKEGQNLAKPVEFALVDKNNRGASNGVEVLSISDTIVLLTPGPPSVTIDIHSMLSAFALEEGLKDGLMLRGAISYGEFDRKKNIMLGSAVDEAASWHESTDWIGVIFTPSAKFAMQGECPRKCIEYPNIPFKKSITGLDWCVDWHYGDDMEQEIQKLYQVFLKRSPHMLDVAPKYLNTIEFFKWRQNQIDKQLSINRSGIENNDVKMKLSMVNTMV